MDNNSAKTLDLFRFSVTPELFVVYEQTIINKIEGKANDTICVNEHPTTLDEVAEVLLHVYGDRYSYLTNAVVEY